MKRTSARLALGVLVAIAVALPVAASGREGATRGEDAARGATIVKVRIKDAGTNRFSPRNVTVPEGTKVRWINKGSLTHTTTSGDWDRTLSPGEKYTRKFRQAGTYSYRCTIHPSMTGTITVT